MIRQQALALAGFANGLAALALAGCASGPLPLNARASAPEVPSARSALTEAAPAIAVAVHIDESVSHQVIEGFGATHNEWFDLATREDLMGGLRPQVIEAVYGRVGITMGQLEVSPYEGFDASRFTTRNDDADPNTFNWSAFNFVRSDEQKTGIVDPARGHGFDNYTIHGGANVRWADPWMADLRRSDYKRYLEEMAENVVAPLVYWRDRFGIVPRWHHLFNEPLSGNGELGGASVQEVVDLVKVVGARLRREGFVDMRLAVPSEETEEASLAVARAILADPEARRYVGAITYHTYPYGSVYSDVQRILATSGEGRPDPGRLKVRNDIRDLARQHGLQVWMTEVSHSNALKAEALRGRAIHIHDELLYADASSYWAMYQAWDDLAPRGNCDDDCLVHFNRARGTVTISGTGYAVGHYARWIRPGAVRVDAESSEPQVLVTAFRHEARKRIAAVIINNRREAAEITISLAGSLALSADAKGEQSSLDGYWQPLAGPLVKEGGQVAPLRLPRQSVTSLSFGFE